MENSYLLVLHIEPRAKDTPRFTKYGRMYTKKDDSDWRMSCAEIAAKEWGDRPPLKGPLRADITFFMNRPKKAKPTDYWHYKRPDRDNLMKNLCDSLENAGVFEDDAQLACGNVEKILCSSCEEKPRIIVQLTSLCSSVVERP